MKDILDIVVVILFVFMLAMFVINFNRQQIKKHTDKLKKQNEANELNPNKQKEKSDE